MSEEKLMKLNKIGQKTNKVSLIGIHRRCQNFEIGSLVGRNN